jgi:hypothetical protein
MTHLFDLQVDWIDDIADSAARLAKVRIVTQASSIRTRLTGSRLQRAEPAGVQGGGIIPCGAYLCADDELWAELRHDDRLAIPALRDLHRSGLSADLSSGEKFPFDELRPCRELRLNLLQGVFCREAKKPQKRPLRFP